MPKHAQFTCAGFSLANSIDRAVDAEYLLVLTNDLYHLPGAVIEENEILKDIKKGPL